MADRFDKFTEDARRALAVAQEEAERFGQSFIGTEHLLLGLMRLPNSVAARALANLGLELEQIRRAVQAEIYRLGGTGRSEIGLTPMTRKVIELAVEEARRPNHYRIGTEHLLLGLLGTEDGIAAWALSNLGVDRERVRAEMARLPAEDGPKAEPGLANAPTFAPDAPRLQWQPEASAEPGKPRSWPEPEAPTGGGGQRDRFDKFTQRGRTVLALAQEEAQRFNHNYIGTEHLLLGLLREENGVAARVLLGLGLELGKVRSAVEFILGRGDRMVLGEIGLTPRAKKVIELAVDEARRLNHHYIGTEHLLLGLVREGEGIAAGVLDSLGVNYQRVRAATIRVLDVGFTELQPQRPHVPPRSGPWPGSQSLLENLLATELYRELKGSAEQQNTSVEALARRYILLALRVLEAMDMPGAKLIARRGDEEREIPLE
jgi:ATP-dependent Clp protease ATP-binding subunit ClpA